MKTMARDTGARPRPLKLDFAGLGRGGCVWGGPIVDWWKVPRSNEILTLSLVREGGAGTDLLLPTEDFGTPPPSMHRTVLLEVAVQLLRGQPVYVGCGYGRGRTGVFLASLLKLHHELAWLLRAPSVYARRSVLHPVIELRRLYWASAVETKEQWRYVSTFDVRVLARRLAFRESRKVVFDKRFWTP